jgi:hypothetical protein
VVFAESNGYLFTLIDFIFCCGGVKTSYMVYLKLSFPLADVENRRFRPFSGRSIFYITDV